MKRRFPFPGVAFALLLALPCCTPNIASTPAPSSALVTIEYRGVSVRQITQLLRSGRGKDISVEDEGSFLRITAAFSPVDTTPAKLTQMLNDLNVIDGVLRAGLGENPHPIRQSF